MLYKSVSSKVIIDQVMSRFGITDGNIEFDALEWIGLAIGLIGTHVNFVNVVTSAEVQFFKILLPCNFYQLNFIAYNGRKLNYGKQSSYSYTQSSQSDDPFVVDLIQSIFVKNKLAGVIEQTDCNTPDAEDLLNKQDLLDNKIANLISFVEASSNYCADYWYANNESGECFDTNIETGEVYISYKAYPVDKNGYPLIINEAKYRLALEWYVVRCLLERGYRHPVLDYRTVDTKTREAINQASNEHLKMSYEEADNFVSNWTNMKFQLNPHNNNYYSN